MNEKGSALISVLIVTALLMTIGAVLLNKMQINLKTATNQMDYQICVLSAKNEFEESTAQIIKNPSYKGKTEWVQDENNVAVQSHIAKIDTQHYFIEVKTKRASYTKIFQGEVTVETTHNRIEKMTYRLIK